MRTPPGAIARAALFVALASCVSMRGQLGDDFSRAHTCPRGRVVITERPDIKPLPPEHDPPPPEVAADAERLALWRERHEKGDARWRDATVFDVDGCGYKERNACISTNFDPDGSNFNYVTCISQSERRKP